MTRARAPAAGADPGDRVRVAREDASRRATSVHIANDEGAMNLERGRDRHARARRQRQGDRQRLRHAPRPPAVQPARHLQLQHRRRHEVHDVVDRHLQAREGRADGDARARGRERPLHAHVHPRGRQPETRACRAAAKTTTVTCTSEHDREGGRVAVRPGADDDLGESPPWILGKGGCLEVGGGTGRRSRTAPARSDRQNPRRSRRGEPRKLAKLRRSLWPRSRNGRDPCCPTAARRSTTTTSTPSSRRCAHRC